jgi:hypothetical protein
MESHDEMLLIGETEKLQEKPVPVSLFPGHISQGLSQASAVTGW